MKERFGIVLTELEVNQFFFDVLKIERRDNTLDFINQIILRVAETIPFQNIEMTANHFEKPLSEIEIKHKMLSGKGGICTTVNPFMASVLYSIGYDVHLIACGRKNEDKRHVALCVQLNGKKYFIDFGDAQPYFEAIELNNNEVEYQRSFRSYKVFNISENIFRIELKKDDTWTPYFEFDTTPVSFDFFKDVDYKFYADLDFGPFWKQVHFGLYPNKKLIAIRGNTFIIEKEYGIFENIKAYNKNQFNDLINQYLPNHKVVFDFINARNKIYELNSIKRFGLALTDEEFNKFLAILNIDSYESTFDFLNLFISKIFETIPFQNITMLMRGKGKSPSVNDIKEDMLSGLGGPCGTMNPFIGSILFKMGFDIHLVAGTMGKLNDHLALLLNWNNEKYYIDGGDGQPYFKALPIKQNQEYYHPFKIFKLVPIDSKKFEIWFLNNETWIKDVEVDVTPRDFSFFEQNINQHYTDVSYGPFWEGIRFSCYPKGRIIAIRNNVFIYQDSENKIIKENFINETTLKIVIGKYFKNYRHEFINAYLKINSNGNN